MQNRKLSLTGPSAPDAMALVAEAYRELQNGKLAEAKYILDRLLFPKWKEAKECEAEYKRLTKQASADRAGGAT